MTGRELDAEVAEKVMGMVLAEPCPSYPIHVVHIGTAPTYKCVDCAWVGMSCDTDHKPVPYEYSTSIEAAFQVVEKMRERGYEFGLSGFFMAEKRWLAEFWKDDMSRKEEFYTTAPEAICRAALSALTTLKEQGHAG